MMERNALQRVDASAQSVTRLGTLFQRPLAAAPGTSPDVQDIESAEQALERERTHMLERARQEGHEQGMRAAQEEIQAAIEAARSECEAAHAKALEEVQQARSRLTDLLRRLPGMIDGIEDGALETAAELAYAALLRLLDETPGHDRILAVCRQALHEQQKRPVVVRVASEDIEAIASLANDASVRVEADARLQPGQCQLDTALGTCDTGLDVRLDQLREAFLRGIATARTLP